MKLKILILISFLSAVTSLWAKAEVKQPDSYAYTRGIEEYQNGNLQDALDWFDKELSEHPDNGYAYTYISLIRFGNHEYGKALSAIDNALKRLPKKDKKWRAAAFDSRAEIYAALNDTVKAMADLSQAIQMDPSSSSFLLLQINKIP